MPTAIKLRPFSLPTSRGLSAGSMNLSTSLATSLDPTDKPWDVGSPNLMAVGLMPRM